MTTELGRLLDEKCPLETGQILLSSDLSRSSLNVFYRLVRM